MWKTRDNRFVVGSYVPGHPNAHLLVVMFWERTIAEDPDNCDLTVRVDVADLTHAQQVVDQITMAMAAAPAEQTS
ncbi:hypothetical protein [Nocardia suismassiliense]|uniref:hypothetical protein n=1 Tax=Nocardia suismassiliense TaxID=2077092 RepID=UPI000D1FBCE1|nr:hypothetical protein [Nocardia suismassiliense]